MTVTRHGGVTKVPLTKELLSSVASARTRYRLYLETERKKKESLAQGQKRKAAEDYLEELKKGGTLYKPFLKVFPEMQTNLQRMLRARLAVRWLS